MRFKNRSRQLRRIMWWKNIKVRRGRQRVLVLPLSRSLLSIRNDSRMGICRCK